MAVAITMCDDVFSTMTTHRPSAVKSENAVRFRSIAGDYTENVVVFGRIINVDVVDPRSMVLRPTGIQANRRANYMTRFLDLSIHDLAIMVGLGCFTGSAMSVAWSLFSASSAPKEFAIPAALLGFVLGKILSDRSEGRSHA
jgi:hypothetical protein